LTGAAVVPRPNQRRGCRRHANRGRRLLSARGRAGLDPADYAGHSLRSGFATEAAARGVPERAIVAQTGHRSVQVLRGYICSGGLFTDNAAEVRL
jgi:integrase